MSECCECRNRTSEHPSIWHYGHRPQRQTILPAQGQQMAFYVFSSNECVVASAPGPASFASVPAGGTAYVEASDTALDGFPVAGTYFIRFAEVLTASGQSVNMDPVLVQVTQPAVPNVIVTGVDFPASGPAGRIFLQNTGTGTAYITNIGVTYAGGSCSVGVSSGSLLVVSPGQRPRTRSTISVAARAALAAQPRTVVHRICETL